MDLQNRNIEDATISVLISVYKSEKAPFLDEAIHSIWTEQTMKPSQIVLVEDGLLTDELYAVIAKWKDQLGDVLTIIKNDENIGLTKSLNKGIKHVTSKYIARMDSDDRSVSDRFELQVEYLQRNGDVDIVGGFLQEFDSENPCLNVRRYPTTPDEAKRNIYKVSPLAHPSVMMRTKLFTEDSLSYNEKYRTSQDIALWFDAVCTGHKIGNIDKVLICFRRDGDVYKRRSKAKAWNEFKIYCDGINRMYGIISLKYIYPISRLIFRLMPIYVVRWGYNSKLRTKIAER